jgi:hypothetical protein
VNWSDLIFGTLSVFIRWPLGALVPAAAFALAYALAWLLYALWESLIYLRIACRGDCNIRVDLLFMYPLLWLASIAGLAALSFGRQRRGPA